MATLNTLRTKGGWIVTIVIGLALLAFLIGDLAGGNSVFGVREKVGKIDGQSISYMEYAQEVEYYTQINKITSGTESLSNEQQDQIRNYVWQNMVTNVAIKPGLQKLGIQVGEDEIYDLIYGNNISPMLINWGFFTNPETGMFDKSYVRNFVSNLAYDQTGSMRMLWQYIQDQVRDQALMDKYVGMIDKMVYVTDLEAGRGVAQANDYYNARYVSQQYSSIADSTVKVSAAEIRKYYDERKELYRQDASRDVEYVVFDVLPSAKDYADAEQMINSLAAELAEADNVQQYVTLNSQDAFDPSYYTQAQLPADLAEFAFSRDNSGVFGPQLQNETYSVYRVSDVKSFPDTIGFRQMLLAPGQDAQGDSLLNVLKRGGDFDTIAAEFSLIPAGQTDAGRVTTQAIPMEVGETIYNSRDKYILVSNPNGVLIMDVYYRGPVSEKVQIGAVHYFVEPSAATQQAAYAKASAFSTQSAGLYEQFNKIAADSVYSKRVARIGASDLRVTGLENSRELIRWAFNAKKGALSGIMEIDGNYVVAALTGSQEAGYTPVEQVSSQISMELVRQKKAEMLIPKMTGATSLQALAQSLNAEVGEVSELNYNSFFIPDLGVDPALIGAICGGVPEGQVSKPIRGMAGVYVVEITAKETRNETTIEAERVRQEAIGQNYIDQRAMQALSVLSNVVDGRAKYF